MKIVTDGLKMSIDYMSGRPIVAFYIKKDDAAAVDELKDNKLSIDIKKHREKRSLDANAYFWFLCGELAERIGAPAREIYREYVKDIGGNFEIVPLKADEADRRNEIWESRGVGWVCETLGESKLDGYINVIRYYGSSTYDTAQMSRLIDLVVYDCKEQGIQTETPEQIANRVSLWRVADGKVNNTA